MLRLLLPLVFLGWCHFPTQAQASSHTGVLIDMFFTLVRSHTKSELPRNCLASLNLHFNKPINIATLLGSVLGLRSHTQKKPFYLAHASADLKNFSLKLASKQPCIPSEVYQSIKIVNGVHNTFGEKLSRDIEVPLGKIPSRQGSASFTKKTQPLPVSKNFTLDSATWQKPLTLKSSFHVKAAVLSEAFKTLSSWEQQEKIKPWYQQRLSLLPLSGVILQPFERKHRSRQFAHPDLIYVLRRAAVFTAALFPKLNSIPVADLSSEKGQTPQVQLGRENILLHPAGSHQHGYDADIAYITTGGGNDKGAVYDWEKNFWFLYSVLQSSGVDLVISAYRDKLRSLAHQAYKEGLISSAAVGRFNSILADQELNHDKHVHISVKNMDNAYRSLRFLPNDDVYTCYLALRPDLRGGNFNFCDSTNPLFAQP